MYVNDIYISFLSCLIFSRTNQEWQYHISYFKDYGNAKISFSLSSLSEQFKAYCNCTWKIGEQTLFGAKYSCIV